MKRQKAAAREILWRIESGRFERRLVSARKRRLRNREESRGTSSPGRPSTSKFSRISPLPGIGEYDDHLVLDVPKNLDLVRNYAETAEFIRDMRRSVLHHNRRVYLVFNDAERIRPAALLLLLAEIHRCRLSHGPNMVTGTYPNNPNLERLMCRTGFFKLLNVKERTTLKVRGFPVEYIEFRSNNKLDTAEPKRLRTELLGDSITMHPKVRSRLYRSLTEAMINVGQHAYPQSSVKSHPVKKRWWLAGHVNKRKKELMVTFCDLGVGIPETLPKIYTWERIRSALSLLPGIRPNDGQMIEAAMTIGRSRTREEHRGRGLNDLRSLIDQAGSGELYIFSRKGRYRYRAGGDEEAFNSNISINGTLIKWSVPLDRVTDWIGNNDELESDD